MTRGALLIDTARLHATWQEKPLGLTLTEFWIVHALAKNPGHVKNRQQLMDAANVVLDDNTITSHVKRIRRKFQAIDAVLRQHRDDVRHGVPVEGIGRQPGCPFAPSSCCSAC